MTVRSTGGVGGCVCTQGGGCEPVAVLSCPVRVYCHGNLPPPPPPAHTLQSTLACRLDTTELPGLAVMIS